MHGTHFSRITFEKRNPKPLICTHREPYCPFQALAPKTSARLVTFNSLQVFQETLPGPS